jgi:RHS repeat-associated protein
MKPCFVLAVFAVSWASLSAARLEQYDAAGNTILQNHNAPDSVQILSYDSQNRIIRVVGGNGLGFYGYSDGGLRLRKRTAPASTSLKPSELLNPGIYLTLDSGPDTEPTNRGSIALTNHIYLNGVRIAAIAPTSSGTPAIRYYLTDQVNSVKIVLDGLGNILARHEYLPYGEEFVREPSENGGAAIWAKFNSQEKDEESGLDFFNARHYTPDIARFVSADTVIDGEASSQGWNRYLYVHGNPVAYADPTGTVWEKVVRSGKAVWKYGFSVFYDKSPGSNVTTFLKVKAPGLSKPETHNLNYPTWVKVENEMPEVEEFIVETDKKLAKEVHDFVAEARERNPNYLNRSATRPQGEINNCLTVPSYLCFYLKILEKHEIPQHPQTKDDASDYIKPTGTEKFIEVLKAKYGGNHITNTAEISLADKKMPFIPKARGPLEIDPQYDRYD